MIQKPKFYTSFAALNLTQFCSALNDNVYKLLLVFMLISVKGSENSNTILSLAGVVFVIPYLIFANLAGTLSDRLSKRSIIFYTRFLEIFIVAGGTLSMAFETAIGGYTVLFLMATQSAIFSPSKYGIIPEIVKKEKVSKCNGVITATTYLAIILGTFLASFLSEITHKNFFLSSLSCVVIAIAGFLFSLGIEKTAAQAQEKEVSAKFLSGIYKTLKRSRKVRYLLTTIIVGGFFLYLGAYTQLNIIPFTFQSLGLSEIQGGYLFLMTSIGIGLGSFLAGRLSGKEVELGFVPLATCGIFINLIALYFWAESFFVVVPLLILLGVLGGFYVVPIDAFIQLASPSEDRGQNIAAANFISFIGVILASGTLALFGNVFNFSAAQGFLATGIITAILTVCLLIIFADQVLRLFVSLSARLFWSLKVTGRRNVRLISPALLIGKRESWLDTIVVMATLPRLIRYIVPMEGRFAKARSVIYKLVRLIPLGMDHLVPLSKEAYKEIKKEIDLGHSVCLMLPFSNEWQKKIDEIKNHIDVPIIPINIIRTPSQSHSLIKQLKSLRTSPIKVSFGSKLPS